MGSSIVQPIKSTLGLQKDPQAQQQFSGFQRTPEQIKAENDLLAQLSLQSQAQVGGPAADLAQRKAMSMAASQSRGASNPYLGIKAAQMASGEMQEQAKLNEQERQMNTQRMLSDLITGQRQSALSATQSAADLRQQEQGRRASFIGNLAASGGQLAMGGNKQSDEDIKVKKKAIENTGGKIDDFLSTIDPYTFEYKNKELGGKQMGVMAQDLEKSDIGRAAVSEVDGVKQVNPEHLALPMLAAQSDMFKRIKELEDKVKKRG